MKTARLSIRIHPHDKEILEYLAAEDYRSTSDMVTVLIRKAWAERNAQGQRIYDEEQAILEGVATCEDFE